MTPRATLATQASYRVVEGSLAEEFVLGTLLGEVWGPCSGPLLASGLTLVATEDTVSGAP